MGKKLKNLTPQDIEDVSIYEETAIRKTTATNGYKLQDIQIKVKCLNEKQKVLKQAIEDKDVVISIGAPGTGKTYLSLITALHLMKNDPSLKNLVLVKSVQTITGEDIGYLPGTLKEKMEPYIYSFVGNLNKIFCSKLITKKLMDNDTIQVLPIAYVRGVTIDNAVIIIDEAQNIDAHTFRTLITRLGKNSKIIFLGDIEQIDRKDKSSSCLHREYTRFKDKDFVGTVKFEKDEIVRNPLITKILEVLDEEEISD